MLDDPRRVEWQQRSNNSTVATRSFDRSGPDVWLSLAQSAGRYGAKMADVRITCITKSHPQGGNEFITHVGALDGRWRWTKEQTIRSIEDKSNTFFVVDAASGKRADVGVVRPSVGTPYLRTYADGIWTDNLLSLPACR